MKVVILSGGSGSTEIQKGLSNYPNIDIDILVNGYDNGKSTGLVRKVFNGNILGPSDIRKNQFLQYKLQYPSSNLCSTLDFRFTSDKPEEFILEYLEANLESKQNEFFSSIIKRYFKNPKSTSITYEDFSIANIIYAQLAAENNSMQKASDIIRDFLEIKNRIIVNHDESLFLYAKTENGHIIYDEADIVEYNSENRITDIGFFDSKGNDISHSKISETANSVLKSADIIIFSSGTQWSSLIPTYKSFYNDISFKDLIDSCDAKKYLVMNSTKDSDMIDLSADDILNIIKSYINLDEVNVIIDKDAVEGMNICSNKHLGYKLSGKEEKHNGSLLVDKLLNHSYCNPSINDTFIFDWDDTIHARNGLYRTESKANSDYISTLDHYVVTGNTIHSIDTKSHHRVFADGGMNLYINGKYTSRVLEESDISSYIPHIIDMLGEVNINSSMIQNRNDTCLTIKPIDPFYRKIAIEFINSKIDDSLIARAAGNTSIDILYRDADKIDTVKLILEDTNKSVHYVGDEYKDGNDSKVYNNREKLGINFIKVDSVLDTNILLTNLSRMQEWI